MINLQKTVPESIDFKEAEKIFNSGGEIIVKGFDGKSFVTSREKVAKENGVSPKEIRFAALVMFMWYSVKPLEYFKA